MDCGDLKKEQIWLGTVKREGGGGGGGVGGGGGGILNLKFILNWIIGLTVKGMYYAELQKQLLGLGTVKRGKPANEP